MCSLRQSSVSFENDIELDKQMREESNRAARILISSSPSVSHHPHQRRAD